MKRAPKDARPGKDWLTFLRNHKEAIAAMDFFTGNTILNGCSLNTSATILETAHILALPSKHRPAEFPVPLAVESCLTHDLADSIIVRIGPRDADFAQWEARMAV